jgi:Kelch motif/Galactose oxidase, central domain
MNLPSLTRATFATGILSVAFSLSALATPTPPYLRTTTTKLALGSAVSGAAAHLSGHMYFAGGIVSGGTVTNEVSDFDQVKRTVTKITGMPTARAGLGLVGFFNPSVQGNNVLYAIGGTNGSTPLGANEMYNPATGTWTVMPSMPTPRAYLTVVGGTDGKIYAIGGVDSSGHSVATVEIYNTNTNSWSTGPSLLTPRSHHAATLVYVSTIFVAGGEDANGKLLNTTEVYSLQTGGGVWVPAASLNTARADFGLALAGDGFLHALGGRSSTGLLRTIEGWRFSTNTWTTEPHKLPTALSGIAAAEGLSGGIFVIGGENGAKKIATDLTKAFPPMNDTAHSVTYYVHSYDEPYVNGNFAMDQIAPIEGLGLLNLGLLSTTNFSGYPAVSGTIESGGSVTVNIPATVILGLINGVTVSATDQDGGNAEVLGSVSSLLGLSGEINVPINAPVRLTNNKVLVLTISSLLGVDLNLGGGYVTVTLNGLVGKPSDPQ